MKQRTSEWLETPKLEYHERQLFEVYRSTVSFCDWLEKIGHIKADSKTSILDLGCGLGANLIYMGKRYPKCQFTGVDLNPAFVERGNRILSDRGIENVQIDQGDWYNLASGYIGIFDGVVSFQTLSWLPGFEEALGEIAHLRPSWIALTSLFYDGLVSSANETQTYGDDLMPYRNMFYNVYSIPVVKESLRRKGYGNFKYERFDIDIDLPCTKEFRAHTEKLDDGRRILISGPVLEPYYFISAEVS